LRTASWSRASGNCESSTGPFFLSLVFVCFHEDAASRESLRTPWFSPFHFGSTWSEEIVSILASLIFPPMKSRFRKHNPSSSGRCPHFLSWQCLLLGVDRKLVQWVLFPKRFSAPVEMCVTYWRRKACIYLQQKQTSFGPRFTLSGLLQRSSSRIDQAHK
jgi:hypothetical protein